MTLSWPPENPQSGPSVARIKLPADHNWDARSAEDVVERLYAAHHWNTLQRRFRIRGSEIDLAVIQPTKNLGRIVEVKLRLGQPRIDLEFTKSLLPPKKVAALVRGARVIETQAHRRGMNINWSFDMALVVPEIAGNSCLVYTWTNVLEIAGRHF